MRIGMKNRICFKILYIRKIAALFIILAITGICVCNFFVKVYNPYITSAAISKANYIIQQIVNKTILDITEKENFSSFIKVLKDEQQNINGIETDVIKINRFKALLLKDISGKFGDLSEQKFSVPLFSFLNNPFLSEIGPYINIRIKPLGMIKADFDSSFVSEGVNQTKHQMDLKFEADVIIVIPGMKIEHSISSDIPGAQTVIVGKVPESYTYISTTEENLEDTVLQLAGN